MPTWFTDPETFVPPPARSSATLVVLSEFLSASALTGMLGAPADDHWERGDLPHARGRFAGYKLGSRLAPTASPGDHLTDLLVRLMPIQPRLRALVDDDRVSVRLWIGHHIPNWNPGLSLSAEQVRMLDALGTGLELDIYVVGEDEDDPGG